MEITFNYFAGTVGGLVSIIAVLYMRANAAGMQLLRHENEKLWEQIGELRGALQQTRENYVSKPDFDGAFTRLFNKLDGIDQKINTVVSRDECRTRMQDLQHRIKN